MWLAGRLASSVAVLAVVSAVLFALARLTPLSPARIVLGADATQEQMLAWEHDRGLDRAIPAQFVHWAGELPTAGFGKSYITGKSIDEELRQSAPLTLELVLAAFVLALAGAVALGTIGALWEDR